MGRPKVLRPRVFLGDEAACNLRHSLPKIDLLDHPAPDQLSTQEGLNLIDDLADWNQAIS